MDSQSTSSIRARMMWTQSMDHCFIGLMVDEVTKGNKNDQGFTRQGWMNLVTKFNQSTGLQFDKDKLKNRYKSLKREYGAIKLLRNHSGFGWDEQRQMVTADGPVWEDYCKAHPDASKFRTRSILHYDELCTIFSNQTANGRFAATCNETIMAVGIIGNQEIGVEGGGVQIPPDDMSDNVSEDANIGISRESKRRSETKFTSQRLVKAQRSSTEEMVDAINRMADAIASMARGKQTLGEALEELPGLDDDQIFQAYVLLEDKRKAEFFMEMTPAFRKRWLLLNLHQGPS
ncbi:uncharacterized protein LOC143845761 [Tasmannia lanceolata]|uniref:uncharacterized protein LOC143845761 n=1 Tax=Tasmannia lanceolata TaxID=3420 RepID=UPI004063967F